MITSQYGEHGLLRMTTSEPRASVAGPGLRVRT